GIPRRRLGLVLNAFRRHGLPHRNVRTDVPLPIGAQRLSASRTSSRVGRRPACTRRSVLNAFRRHGLPHPEPSDVPTAPTMCSTPFGVTDFLTSAHLSQSLPAVRCSTPFGVTDFLTCLHFLVPSPDPRAQRLSASRTSSRFSPGRTEH